MRGANIAARIGQGAGAAGTAAHRRREIPGRADAYTNPSTEATTMTVQATPTRTVYLVVHGGTALYEALNRQAAEAFKTGWKAAGGGKVKIETSTEPKRRR